MHPRRFLQVDVFSSHALRGNALAVVLDGEGLDTATMQRFAAWTALAETVFLLPPTTTGADYRVRIFTSREEIPFAGHPSVGAAYAALHAGILPEARGRYVQECGAGLLQVSVQGEGAGRVVSIQAPDALLENTPAGLRATVEAALSVSLSGPPRPVVNGPRWIVCDLEDGSQVRALRPDMRALAALIDDMKALGLCVFGKEHDGTADMAVRAFCPSDSLPEDPVTGSANAAIAALLYVTGGLARYGMSHAGARAYRASQGREVGYDGYVDVTVSAAGGVTIGGACSIVIEGTVHL